MDQLGNKSELAQPLILKPRSSLSPLLAFPDLPSLSLKFGCDFESRCMGVHPLFPLSLPLDVFRCVCCARHQQIGSVLTNSDSYMKNLVPLHEVGGGSFCAVLTSYFFLHSLHCIALKTCCSED